jgi:hypothetical protein
MKVTPSLKTIETERWWKVHSTNISVMLYNCNVHAGSTTQGRCLISASVTASRHCTQMSLCITSYKRNTTQMSHKCHSAARHCTQMSLCIASHKCQMSQHKNVTPHNCHTNATPHKCHSAARHCTRSACPIYRVDKTKMES